MTLTEDNVPLRVAVFQTIRLFGVDILRQPKRFLSNILDEVDPEARTTQPFERNCTEDFLRIYLDAAKVRTPQAIDDAAQKATVLLSDKRMLQKDMARRLACEIAFGVSSALGISCSEWVRIAATEDLNATPVQGTVSSTTSESGETQQSMSSASNAFEEGSLQSRGRSSVALSGTSRGASSTTSASTTSYRQSSVMTQGSSQSQRTSGLTSVTSSANVTRRPSPQPAPAPVVSSQQPAPSPVVSSQQPAPAPAALSTSATVPATTGSYSPLPSERRKQAKERGVFLAWNSIVRFWSFVSVVGSIILAFNALDTASNPMFGTQQYWSIRTIILLIIALGYGIALSHLGEFRRSGVIIFYWICIINVIATTLHASSAAYHPKSDLDVLGIVAIVGCNSFILVVSLVYYNSVRQKELFSL